VGDCLKPGESARDVRVGCGGASQFLSCLVGPLGVVAVGTAGQLTELGGRGSEAERVGSRHLVGDPVVGCADFKQGGGGHVG
jgi:hypothetical protein